MGKFMKMKDGFCGGGGGRGGFYFLGFIGAAIYFVSEASSFWYALLGIVKAVFWPAFLIYGLLKYLGI